MIERKVLENILTAVLFYSSACIATIIIIPHSYITAYIVRKNIQRISRYNEGRDHPGGSNWIYRMLLFSASLFVSVTAPCNLILPVFFGHTDWFLANLANKVVFQKSWWHTVMRLTYGCNYAMSFGTYAIMLQFLISRLKVNKWKMQFHKLEGVILGIIGLICGALGYQPMRASAHFRKLPCGIYIFCSEADMNTTVIILIILLFIICLCGFPVMYYTRKDQKRYLDNVDVETTQYGKEKRRRDNMKKLRNFTKSTMLFAIVFVIGFVNTIAIRCSIMFEPLRWIFEPSYAILPVTSTAVSFVTLRSLYIVHSQTRDDHQESLTRILPEWLCPDHWKRPNAVVQRVQLGNLPPIELH